MFPNPYKKHTIAATSGMNMDAVATLLLKSVRKVTMIQVMPINAHCGNVFSSDIQLPIRCANPLLSTPAKSIQVIILMHKLLTFRHTITATEQQYGAPRKFILHARPIH
jgi:hypothetical protein